MCENTGAMVVYGITIQHIDIQHVTRDDITQYNFILQDNTFLLYF